MTPAQGREVLGRWCQSFDRLSETIESAEGVPVVAHLLLAAAAMNPEWAAKTLKELDAAVTAMGGSADLGHMYENAQEFVRIAVIS